MTFAAFGFNPDHVAALAMNALAVGGGFLAGYAVTALAAYLLDRRLTGGKSPEGLHKTVRMLGGVCGAVLVALLVFRGGGGGPGDGPGTTAATGAGSGSGTTAVTSPTPDPASNPKPPEPARTEEVVRVTVLSGADVVDEKFYLVGIQTERLTLGQAKRALASYKASTIKSLTVEVVLSDRADPNGSGAQSLIGAARDAGYAVRLPEGR